MVVGVLLATSAHAGVSDEASVVPSVDQTLDALVRDIALGATDAATQEVRSVDAATDSGTVAIRGQQETGLTLPSDGGPQSQINGSLTYNGKSRHVRIVSTPVKGEAVAQTTGSVRNLITIGSAEASTRYEFPVTLPRGARLVPQPDGGVNAIGRDGSLLGVVAAPWAVDGAGKAIRTHFTIKGNTLVQTVDHRQQGVRYPVIADPWWFVPVAVARTATQVVILRYAVRAATSQAARYAARQAALRSGRDVKYVGKAAKGNFFTAAGFTIRWYTQFYRRHGYRSFSAFLRAHPGRKDYDWHHIVEQKSTPALREIRAGRSWKVHNKANLILIRRAIHQRCINAIYNSKIKNLTRYERAQLGFSDAVYDEVVVRRAINGFSMRNAHTAGLVVLRLCGVVIGDRPMRVPARTQVAQPVGLRAN